MLITCLVSVVTEVKVDYRLVLQSLLRIRDEIDDIVETLEVLSDKELLKGIEESLEEARRGEGVSIEVLLKKIKRSKS